MRHEVVTVVASGWSASLAVYRQLPGHVIAVNDSAYYLPERPDEIVSMDRMWAELRWEWLKSAEIPTWLRRTCVQNLSWSVVAGFPVAANPRSGDPEWLTVYDCDHETAEFAEWPNLNGRNSGACALNRAWQYRPNCLYLVGFDMQLGPRGELRWHPSYPEKPQRNGKTFVNTSGGKYRSWTEDFPEIAAQFSEAGTKVYIVSGQYSKIKSFPGVSVDEMLREYV